MSGTMRKRVGEFRIGDVVVYGGQEAVIDGFPTRYSVTLKATDPRSGFWSTAKVSIGEIRKKAG